MFDPMSSVLSPIASGIGGGAASSPPAISRAQQRFARELKTPFNVDFGRSEADRAIDASRELGLVAAGLVVAILALR